MTEIKNISVQRQSPPFPILVLRHLDARGSKLDPDTRLLATASIPAKNEDAMRAPPVHASKTRHDATCCCLEYLESRNKKRSPTTVGVFGVPTVKKPSLAKTPRGVKNFQLLLHDPLRLVLLVLGGNHLGEPLFHVRKSARARREVSNPVASERQATTQHGILSQYVGTKANGLLGRVQMYDILGWARADMDSPDIA